MEENSLVPLGAATQLFTKFTPPDFDALFYAVHLARIVFHCQPRGLGSRAAHPRSAREFVPKPYRGEYPLRILGVIFQLLSQPCHVNINGASRWSNAIPPDFVEKLLARQGGAAMLHEITEQLKFLGGQSDGLAVA